MGLDVRVHLVVPDRVLTLLERLVGALEVSRVPEAPGPSVRRSVEETAEKLAAVGGTLGLEGVPQDSAGKPGAGKVSPIAETMPPAAEEAREAKRGWTPERRAAQRERMRKKFADPAYAEEVRRRRWGDRDAGDAGQDEEEAAAETPPAVAQPPRPPAAIKDRKPVDVAPPAPLATVAVPFANVAAWAGERGLPFRTWEDLPKVNVKRLMLGLALFAREEPRREGGRVASA